MTMFTNESKAYRAMVQKNRTHQRKLWVLVDGPAKGYWAVMTLEEAIDNGFSYSWAINN